MCRVIGEFMDLEGLIMCCECSLSGWDRELGLILFHISAGKDAARAYATGCFQTHLTHDLRELTESEIHASLMLAASAS